MTSTAARPVDLAGSRFVSLTTYRRSGAPVSTPVWATADGDELVVLTPAGSGKTKRLAHTPRVQVQPCGRFGALRGGPVVEGHAVVVDDPAEVERVRSLVRRAYPGEYQLVMGVERLVERVRGRAATRRVALRITR